MSDYDNPNIDATILNAWSNAEQACFDYIVYATGSKAGYNAFIGDLPEDSLKINIFAFMLSGSDRDQEQNFQCPTPNKRFFVTGYLGGVYKTRKEALHIASSVMNALPAYWVDDSNAEVGAVPNRGIEPNVSLFELTEHPECYSFKEDNKDRVWILSMEFRCVYTDSEN